MYFDNANNIREEIGDGVALFYDKVKQPYGETLVSFLRRLWGIMQNADKPSISLPSIAEDRIVLKCQKGDCVYLVLVLIYDKCILIESAVQKHRLIKATERLSCYKINESTEQADVDDMLRNLEAEMMDTFTTSQKIEE